MNHISQDRPTCRCYVKSPTADTREGGGEGGRERERRKKEKEGEEREGGGKGEREGG